MSAAAFVMAINLFVAGIFATAFGVVGIHARSAVGARWLALAYGLGMTNPVLEFLVPLQIDSRPMQIAIFATALGALGLIMVGLARHYRLEPPWRLLTGIIVASLLVNIAILDLPRGTLLRDILYQAPYCIVQLVGVAIILRHPRRKALDRVLLVFFVASALQFLAKPGLAAMLGSGATSQAYIGTTYAAISQSLGAMLLIANGLLMLLIIMRDTLAEMTARSETDTLSGLLNRRGFEARTEQLMAVAQRNGTPCAVVVADLDHFKAINDSFGHEAGDRVIAAFAAVLRSSVDDRAILGRLGGEEFAVFIPGANLAVARLYAEGVRTSFGGLLLIRRRASASFGVAELRRDEDLPKLMRRADRALYQAKADGRDRVCLASDIAELPATDLSA